MLYFVVVVVQREDQKRKKGKGMEIKSVCILFVSGFYLKKEVKTKKKKRKIFLLKKQDCETCMEKYLHLEWGCELTLPHAFS